MVQRLREINSYDNVANQDGSRQRDAKGNSSICFSKVKMQLKISLVKANLALHTRA